MRNVNGIYEENIVGFNAHRLNKDDDYHKIEVKLNEQFNKMELKSINQAIFGVDKFGDPKDFLSVRELTIVASLIQWLGTPVGKQFLEESGFEYKEK
jgi:hypothetical protein